MQDAGGCRLTPAAARASSTRSHLFKTANGKAKGADPSGAALGQSVHRPSVGTAQRRKTRPVSVPFCSQYPSVHIRGNKLGNSDGCVSTAQFKSRRGRSSRLLVGPAHATRSGLKNNKRSAVQEPGRCKRPSARCFL